MTAIHPDLAPDGRLLEGEALARRLIELLHLRLWRGNTNPTRGALDRVWCTVGDAGGRGELILVDARSDAWAARLEDGLGLVGADLVRATLAVRALARSPEFLHISEWLGGRP